MKMSRRFEVIKRDSEITSSKSGTRDVELIFADGVSQAVITNISSQTNFRLFSKEDGSFDTLLPGQKLLVRKANVKADTPPIARQTIAIIGAGLAGSTTALRLAQKGVFCDIYEANPSRVGGRTWSAWFDDSYHNGPIYQGQKYERGGELIDKGHIEIQQLAKELNLNLTNEFLAEVNGTKPLYNVTDSFGNQINYPEEDAIRDFKAVYPFIKADYQAAGFPTLYNSFTRRGAELSNTPLKDYIDNICNLAGLTNNYFNQLLQVAYTEEFGLETSEQSSLNMIYLIAFHGPGQLRLFGQNSEKYTVTEGNDQISIRALDKVVSLGGTPVNIGYRLDRLVRGRDGKYTLSFSIVNTNNSIVTTKQLKYDRVIMAVPVYTMRPDAMNSGALQRGDVEDGSNVKFNWHINVSGAQFCFKKRQAIIGLGPADSSKLMVQFNTRFWSIPPNNCNGDIFATRIVNGKQESFQSTWDTTRGQPGIKGIFTNFTGGDYARETTYTSGVDNPSLVEQQANGFIAKLETVLVGSEQNITRGVDEQILNNYYAKNWKDEQYARGAYTSYYTSNEAGREVSFVGIEPLAEPQDEPNILMRNCHFCGEYTSFEYLGFMNGAVSSGNRVAAEVYDVLRRL